MQLENSWGKDTHCHRSLSKSFSSSCHDSVVGGAKSCRGSAVGCVGVAQRFPFQGVSGCLPYDMDQGLDSDASTAAPGPEGGDEEGSDGVEYVDVDAPSDADPDHSEDEGPATSAERLKKIAASLTHLLTHYPKNAYCSVCNLAKAIRC